MSEDRIKAGLAAFIRSVMAGVDYHALYPCRVVTQNADGTLELKPESAKLASLSSVPIRLAPGVTVKVTASARVLVGFENGEPSKPFAALFDVNAGLTSVHLGGAAMNGSDATGLVAVASRVEAAINSLVTTFNAHTHVCNTAGNPSAVPNGPATSASNTGTVKVKVSG